MGWAHRHQLKRLSHLFIHFLRNRFRQMWELNKIMTTIEERSEYLKNPFFERHLYGDWSVFYKTIAVSTVFILGLIVLNFVLGCCSRHRQYWQDRHTGNRWIVSIWSATPHQQPPLDLTELEDVSVFQPINVSVSTSTSTRIEFKLYLFIFPPGWHWTPRSVISSSSRTSSLR